MTLAFSALAQEKKGGLTEEELKKANNPLANITAFSIHNYYSPSLRGVDGGSTNATMLRMAKPLAEGKLLVRATLPVFNADIPGSTTSGLGGVNVFATYTITDPSAGTLIGIGPMVTSPMLSGTMSVDGNEVEDAFDDSSWRLGGALVIFNAKSKIVQYGGLITYEHSVGSDIEKSTSQAIIQPFMMLQLGKGTYLRSSGSTVLDFTNADYFAPVGMGIGKVLKVGDSVINMFFEPQYTVYSNKEGHSNIQLFSGINFQF